jgi:carbonic anhydrase
MINGSLEELSLKVKRFAINPAFNLLSCFMRLLSHLLENNKHWSQDMRALTPDYFERLVGQQTPEYLWIGCSDSRVPANQIIGLAPGEIFVHRNVANVVVHTDFNCLSVLQYATDILKVKHVMVCGHYGCGGIRAATQPTQFGLVDNWFRHVRDVAQKYQVVLDRYKNEEERLKKLCELNVIEQAYNVCHTTIVQNAWQRGQELAVHGWIYDLHDGLIRDLNITITNLTEISSVYRMATENELVLS